MKKVTMLLIVLASALCASATPVNFQFSYALGQGNVTGVLNTVEQGNGSFLVTDATGSYLGAPITGVFDPSLSGNTFSFNEILYFPAQPSVDIYGIVFELNGNTNIATGRNLYWDGAGYRSIDGANNGPYVNLNIAPLDQRVPTPEPGTMVLLGSGVLGLAGILRRNFGAILRF